MKKKLLVGLIGCMMAATLVGCGESVSVNVENNENLSSTNFAEFTLIGDNLYYDNATRIVYLDGYCTFTPYYAPNGLPYKYNPETSTFEEIEYTAIEETFSRENGGELYGILCTMEMVLALE